MLPPSRPQAYFQFPRRRQPPPTKAALRAALARFDNRPTSGGGFKRRGPKPPPLSLQGDRILKERGKFEIPLSLSGVLWLLSFDMKRKQLAPAGATPARRRGGETPPTRQKQIPLPSLLSAAAAQAVQAIPEPTTSPAEPIPRSQHRQICTCPPRAKGSLDRRSKRLSFPHFFLRRKKCGRRRPPPRQGKTDSPPQRRNPPRAKGSLNRRFEWFSLVTFFLQKKKVTRAGARNAPACARRRNTCSPPGRRNPPPAQAQKKRRPSPSLFLSHQLSVRFRHSSSCSSSNFSFLFSSTSVS